MSPYFISCWIFNRWFCHAKLAHWLFEVHEEHFIRACSFMARLITRSNPSTATLEYAKELLIQILSLHSCRRQQSSIKREPRSRGGVLTLPTANDDDGGKCHLHACHYIAKSCHMQKPSLPPTSHLHTEKVISLEKRLDGVSVKMS